MEYISPALIQGLISSGKTYAEVSEELKTLYPHVHRGLSERSIRCYVKENDVKSAISEDVRKQLAESVNEVGESYGRKMMKGYLSSSRGINVSERKLKALLPAVSPQGHYSRQRSTQERTNPSVYTARYFGHKIHFDQNEKLVHYGVTYVMARDGFSGKIVGGAVMARKNNPIIYDQVYRPAILQYGLWDQLRVDHGKEFYLILYIHEQLRLAGRGDPNIAPYVQTASTYNHIIERMWVELNQRVTYPIKSIITAMDDNGTVNMDLPATKFGVSTVLQRVCEVGMNRMIGAWNCHPIPRHGIPNHLQLQACGISSIHPAEVPQLTVAVEQYRSQGGSIRDPRSFGEDPIENDMALVQQREDLWATQSEPPEVIFSAVMGGNSAPLQNGILKFIELTEELSP